MTKSKKSKILATALCTAVMAGIYAGPVMAATQTELEQKVADLEKNLAAVTVDGRNNTTINGVTFKAGSVELNGRDLMNAGTFTAAKQGNSMALNSNGMQVLVGAEDVNDKFMVKSYAGGNTNGGSAYIKTQNGEVVIAQSKDNKYFDNKFVVGKDGIIVDGNFVVNGATLTGNNVDKMNRLFGAQGDRPTIYAGDGSIIGNVRFNGNGNMSAKSISLESIEGQNKDVATAINGLNSKTTGIDYANGTTTVGGVEFKDGAITAANGMVTKDISAEMMYATDGEFTNSLQVGKGGTDGKVVIKNGDVVTTAPDGTTSYSLNTIGANTAGISREVNESYADGKYVTNKTTDIENGTLTITEETIAPDFGAYETIKKVNVGGNLTVEGTVNGIKFSKDDEGIKLDDINVTELNEWVQENQGTVSGLGERVDKLENKTGGIERTVKTENGVKTSTTSIENGALTIEATEPTTEPGFAGTVKVGVHGDLVVNGNLTVGESFKVDADGNLTTTGTFNGNTITEGAFNGVAINMADGKAVINGVSMGMVGNDAIINGVNINDLKTTVGDIVDADIPDKVEGIEREGNDTTGYTTTIEESFKVHSTDGYDVGTIDVYGSMIQSNDADGGKGVLNGDTLTLTGTGYGNITTISGGNINTNTINGVNFDDLVNRVEDLEDKTQNINGSEGTTAGGDNDIDVPPTTDGKTGINGDVTVGGDLTVGGVINAEGGTIGDVTIAGDKITTGATTIDKNGITVDNGEDGKVEIGGGDVTVTDKDGNEHSIVGNAQDIDRLEQGMASMSNRISKVEDRIDKVGAMSAAIANLRTMGYDPTAPTEIAVGVGQYRSETGVALGMFHYPNKDFMLSLSVSTSGDEVMGGIGATWKFGRKTPEQMLQAEQEKAAKAKVEKALAMKKAAEEAKVAAQQAKHAKMAAEKAAK